MELGIGLTKFVAPIIYGTAIVAFLLTIFYRIEVGLFFIIPFLSLQNILNYANQYPIGKDINDLMIIAMLIRWIITGAKRKEGGGLFVKTPFNIPLLLLMCWTYLELWRGAVYLGVPLPLRLYDPRVVLWKNYVLLPVLFFIVVNNVRDLKHIKILVVIMAIAVLINDRDFYNAIRARDLSEYTNWRFTGTGQALSGNALAVFQAQYAIVLLTLFLFDQNRGRRLIFGVTALFTYYCVLFSFSRSSYLASIMSLSFLAIIRDRRILIVLIFVILAWQVILPQAVIQRIEMTEGEQGYDRTVQERIGMWGMAKSLIAENPLLGIGFGTSAFINVNDGGFTNNTWRSFHSAYLETAVEQGLLGMAFQLMLFFLAIRAGWRLYRTSTDNFLKGLGLGFVGCVVSSMAGNFAGTYWIYLNVSAFYWTFLGLVICGLRISQRAEPQVCAQPLYRRPRFVDEPHPASPVTLRGGLLSGAKLDRRIPSRF
jgi:O-antigen ligase